MTLNWSNRNEGNSSGSVSGLVSEGGGGGGGFVWIECLSDGYIIWMNGKAFNVISYWPRLHEANKGNKKFIHKNVRLP